MSASLVGSEMCIRDRPCHTLGSSKLGGSSSCGPGRQRRSALELQGPCTVSYTHLTLPTICSV
eukprot:3489389-Alexandrium_andersonii.AAC.1